MSLVEICLNLLKLKYKIHGGDSIETYLVDVLSSEDSSQRERARCCQGVHRVHHWTARRNIRQGYFHFTFQKSISRVCVYFGDLSESFSGAFRWQNTVDYHCVMWLLLICSAPSICLSVSVCLPDIKTLVIKFFALPNYTKLTSDLVQSSALSVHLIGAYEHVLHSFWTTTRQRRLGSKIRTKLCTFYPCKY